jgi:hypothetical protein
MENVIGFMMFLTVVGVAGYYIYQNKKEKAAKKAAAQIKK